MVAVPLIFGRLTADDYEDEVARDPRIDALRAKMVVDGESRRSAATTSTPDKRAIGNAVQVRVRRRHKTERVAVDYPIGHRRRREEGIPKLLEKFERSLATRFAPAQCERILVACADQARLEALSVADFMALWVHRA